MKKIIHSTRNNCYEDAFQMRQPRKRIQTVGIMNGKSSQPTLLYMPNNFQRQDQARGVIRIQVANNTNFHSRLGIPVSNNYIPFRVEKKNISYSQHVHHPLINPLQNSMISQNDTISKKVKTIHKSDSKKTHRIANHQNQNLPPSQTARSKKQQKPCPQFLKRSRSSNSSSIASSQQFQSVSQVSGIQRQHINVFKSEKNIDEKLQWIRNNVIGLNSTYISQLSLQLEAIYVDHTATNRPFQAIEKMVRYSKLYSANPHTQFSYYGRISTNLLHYSEKSLLRSFCAEQGYVALPVGSGCTGALEKAIRIMESIEKLIQKQLCKKITTSIYITPYEHHSNILPWVEFFAEPMILSHDQQVNLVYDEISRQITKCPSDQIIISISATSNVTSTLTDIKMMNQIVKEQRKAGKNIYFALDCAAYCCHHQLNLKNFDEVDFAFISPHKNLGGIESTGVLIARKSLVQMLKSPTFPGGGTVSYVKGYKKQDISYDESAFNREVSGTPNHLGFYRAALSFQLLTKIITYDFINERERKNTELFFKMIQKANLQLKQQGHDTRISIYGSHNLQSRANVVTFNFEYGKKGFVPHSLCGLFYSDIFGIQLRSGCFCAGPYGVKLLNISEKTIAEIQEEVQNGIFINKPGYLRLDLTFYLLEYQVEYIANATILIAKYWRNLQKFYTLCKHGEVKILPIFQKYSPENIRYSLRNVVGLQQKLEKLVQEKEQYAKNRQKRLAQQLKKSEQICKDPLRLIREKKSEIHIAKIR